MRVGALRCALPLGCVLETLRPLPVRAVANTPSFVAGVAVIRGEPLPVVDPGLILGGSPQRPSRFIVVKSGQRRVVLTAEEVVGIRQADSESLAGAPPLLSRAQAGIVDRLATLDRDLLLVLQTARLVPEEVWSALAELEAG